MFTKDEQMKSKKTNTPISTNLRLNILQEKVVYFTFTK